MKERILLALGLLVTLPMLHAQAAYTASRSFGVQIGATATSFNSDYVQRRIAGFGVYADVNLSSHIGVEALYRNASLKTPQDIGENDFLAGLRLRFQRRRFTPYVKGLAGTGTLNFQQGFNPVAHSDTYFIYAIGGGLDLRVSRHINLRPIEYEFQRWPYFMPNGLSPTGFSAGAAYVF